MFGSGTATLTLIISNKEMNIMNIDNSLEESALLVNGVYETIKN